MKNRFFILNLLLFLYTFFAGLIYYLYGGILLKTTTGLGFLLIGICNTVFAFLNREKSKKFECLIMLGLSASLLGDIILNIDLIVGALVFALAHLLYLTAYYSVSAFSKRDVFISVPLFFTSASLIWFCPIFNFGIGIMKVVCLVYALIISLMFGKAISLLFQGKTRTFIFVAIGSFLFFVSDLALLFYMFANAGETANTICLLTYFPAQCLLAYSIFENSKSN